MTRIEAAILLACALPLSACAPKFIRVPLSACPVQTLPKPADEKVRVQYLGVGGFLFKRGDDVIMTAPLYTAPGVLEMFLSRELRPNADLINQLFPQDGENARAILVGHSHYDHLMDVPYIALNRAKAADIYGSTNTARMLAPIAAELKAKTPPTKLVSLDLGAGDERSPGRWVSVGSGMRFMALRSEHAPFFTLKINPPFQKGIELPFYLLRGGSLSEDAKELPKGIIDFVQGPVFKFVIDFLDNAGKPAYRIYYEDTGTSTRGALAARRAARGEAGGPCDPGARRRRRRHVGQAERGHPLGAQAEGGPGGALGGLLFQPGSCPALWGIPPDSVGQHVPGDRHPGLRQAPQGLPEAGRDALLHPVPDALDFRVPGRITRRYCPARDARHHGFGRLKDLG